MLEARSLFLPSVLQGVSSNQLSSSLREAKADVATIPLADLITQSQPEITQSAGWSYRETGTRKNRDRH